jgi:hypothetical protein
MERKRPRASIESISQQIRQTFVDSTFRKIVKLQRRERKLVQEIEALE